MEYPITLKIFLWMFHVIIEMVYIPIHIYRLFQKPKKCKPIQDKILLLSALDLAEKIRTKKLTSVSVIKSYIARIQEVNPIINAVIENRFEKAIEDAKKVDNLIQNTDLNCDQIKEKYPLLGVPITIKGSIAVKGMLHSGGRVDHLVMSHKDAIIVEYVKNAGAIPLLTSNIPELCLNWETRNKLIGTTSNPFNSLRTPGGSSGGEASLIGCGASLIGVGSDIAGSLRLPAHNCGIWGHKPTPRVVSTVGHYPDCKQKNEWNEVFTLGPLARYVCDLKMLLSIIAEPSSKALLNLDQKVEIEKIKIFYIEDFNATLADPVSIDVIESLRKVIKYFDSVSKKCTKVELPLMKYCAELSYLRLLNIDDVENVFKGKGEGSREELFKFFKSKSVHEFSTISYGLIRKSIDLIPVKTMNGVIMYIDDLKQSILNMLGDDGVLILPTSPCEATYHGDVYRKLFNGGCLSIFNVLGFPVTNCPIGFSKNKLPIGIQVVSAPYLDRLTLQVAEEIEKQFGGWKFD